MSSESKKVIFHALPPSSNSSVVRCLLDVAKIDYDEVNCWGNTRTPEFIAKFPNNCAPAIEHDGVNVCESLAILRYLCRTHENAKKYYPETDAALCSQIDMVSDFTNTTLAKNIPLSCYPLLNFPSSPGEVGSLKEHDIADVHVDKAQELAAGHLAELLQNKYCDIFLKDTKFLCCDTPTIAEFRFAPLLSQIKVCQKLPDRLTTYLQDCYDSMPGFESAMKPSEEFCSKSFK